MEQLIDYLSITFNNQTCQITTSINALKIDFNTNIAVPISLIVNEAVCNAHKHAFIGNKKGEIKISLVEVKKDNYQLMISDNGTGLPHNFDMDELNSIGFDLIKGLSKQLKGKCEVTNKNGTIIKITFITT